MRSLIVLFAVISLVGCTTLQTGSRPEYSADLSLIRIWNETFYHQHPGQPFPKVYQFTDRGKTLTFVATKHKDWKNSHRLIQAAMVASPPEIILIEGILASWGTNTDRWDEHIKRDLETEGYEDYYACKLARESRIPFLGAELPGKMSDHSSEERDRAVVSRLAQLMSEHDNVMVVYGAGHYVQQEAVLERMFGPAKIVLR